MTRATGPTEAHHRRMHALWNEARVAGRENRLALTSAIVGRRLTSSDDMTPAEARRVIAYMDQLQRTGTLAAKASAFLASSREVVAG